MDNVEKARRSIALLKEAMANTEPTDVFQQDRSDTLEPLLDEALLRRQRDWGTIANYVVGAEPDHG